MHPITNQELPIVSDDVFEAIELFNMSKLGASFSKEELYQLPNIQYEIYRAITSEINDIHQKKMMDGMSNNNKGK